MATSAKAVLYTSKVLKNGEHPILLRLTKDRQQIKIGLGINCSQDLWDKKSNQPKRRHPLYLEIKTAIEKAEHEAERIILNLENQNVVYSLEDIKAKLARTQTNQTVYSYIDEWVEKLKATNRLGYAAAFQSTKNSLMGFRGSKDFDFSVVHHSFLVKWEEYHVKKGTKLNSFFVYLRTFKTIINNARREEVVPAKYNPYKDFGFSKYRRIETKKRAITKEQIEKLKALKPDAGTPIFHSHNYFFFSYYCRGLNFIDLAYLKWDNIKDGRLLYTRKKTKENFSIGLLEPAVKMLEYYKGLTGDLPGQYVFPILSDFHKTETQQRDRIKKMLGVVNKNLKLLAAEAEIDAELTTYVARHSFATVLKKSGVPISQISEMMGHDTEATTRIYLKSFESELLDEASKALL